MANRVHPASWLSVMILALALTGCATGRGGGQPTSPPPGGRDQAVNLPPTPPGVPDPGMPDADSEPIELPHVSSGPTAMQRAQSAMEGMVLGAVIGAQAGPIGAAVGAGTLLVYAAVTGHVPLAGASGPGTPAPRDEERREDALEDELDREAKRGDALESEIEAELLRQEELLRQIEAEQAALEAQSEPQAAPGISTESLAERADPRAAPRAPEDRDLPLAIFEKEEVKIRRGAWGDNERDLEVTKRTLDADLDGKPEQVRYYDDETGQMVRKEVDRDYDGEIDAWSGYRDGRLASRELDTDQDGKPDVWERYRDDRMTAREVDRDSDGHRDAFYTYEGEDLVKEQHDANDDGAMDMLVTYEDRLRVRAEEDRNLDGRMDTWTTYQKHGGEEHIARVEKDTSGNGKADVFETYVMLDGRAVLARREEDKNGNGEIDITSIYENGKLVRREISDPALIPL